MARTTRAAGPQILVRAAATSTLVAALASAWGCSSSTAAPIDGGAANDASSDGSVPIPTTEACTGNQDACLAGTVVLDHFRATPTASGVTLYRVFPHGEPEAVSSVPVALDGTFAFSDVPAWGHYYLSAQASFGAGADSHTLASIVGSFAVPAGDASIPLVIRPVFLEILQQASSGAPTSLAWASAHLYDPTTGAEVTAGKVTFSADGETVPMIFGLNAAGMKSFFCTFPSGTMGGTHFTITTSYPALESSPVAWNLAGDPVTFEGSITSPTGVVTADKPLTVTWVAQPSASYTITELFLQQGAESILRYASPVVAPNVTTDRIPASDLAKPGTYLLNQSYVNATCPATADGCVYNAWTAAETLTAK